MTYENRLKNTGVDMCYGLLIDLLPAEMQAADDEAGRPIVLALAPKAHGFGSRASTFHDSRHAPLTPVHVVLRHLRLIIGIICLGIPLTPPPQVHVNSIIRRHRTI